MSTDKNIKTTQSKPDGYTLLGNVLSRLHESEINFRLEDYEDGFVLSIIDRGVYPRIWSDNFADNQGTIITETADSFINRNVIHSNDWRERWYGETLDEVLYKAYDWLDSLNVA